jgi:hypothetical protein
MEGLWALSIYLRPKSLLSPPHVLQESAYGNPISILGSVGGHLEDGAFNARVIMRLAEKPALNR